MFYWNNHRQITYPKDIHVNQEHINDPHSTLLFINLRDLNASYFSVGKHDRVELNDTLYDVGWFI